MSQSVQIGFGEMNKWFADSRMKFKNNPLYDADFAFNNERINNSPYVIISGKENI